MFLTSYTRISKMSLATKTLLLDKTLFFRPDNLTIAFHLGNKSVHQQIRKIVEPLVQNPLTTNLDKDKERSYQPRNIVTLHLRRVPGLGGTIYTFFFTK